MSDSSQSAVYDMFLFSVQHSQRRIGNLGGNCSTIFAFLDKHLIKLSIKRMIVVFCTAQRLHCFKELEIFESVS